MPRPTSPKDRAPSLTIATEPFDGDGARWVVAQAEAELLARYGFLGDGELTHRTDMFAPPRGFFLVGRIGSGSHPVGGVGLRPLSETVGEVKRLWVDPARRGQRVGLALMGLLETTARDLGYATLRLATGWKQPEAIALYDASGWKRQVEPWDASSPLPEGVFLFSKDLR